MTKTQLKFSMLSLKKAIETVGGVTKLANRLGINRTSIYMWLSKKNIECLNKSKGCRKIPIEKAKLISKVTRNVVTKADLRPDVWD